MGLSLGFVVRELDRVALGLVREVDRALGLAAAFGLRVERLDLAAGEDFAVGEVLESVALAGEAFPFAAFDFRRRRR